MKCQSIKSAAVELLPFISVIASASDEDVDEMLRLDAAGLWEAVVSLRDAIEHEQQQREGSGNEFDYL